MNALDTLATPSRHPAPSAPRLTSQSHAGGGCKIAPGVLALAGQAIVTRASQRNWESYGAEVTLPAGISPAQQALLCDPQPSGGLLVSRAPEAVGAVIACFESQRFDAARRVGGMVPGSGAEVF